MIKSVRRRPAVSSDDDTRTRILDTAERLFAEQGIESVSVRAILAEAKVNVALAHYHFGSREGLIREFVHDRIDPLVQEQLAGLKAVDARGRGATLEEVLRAYFAPAARWLVAQPRRARLLAQMQTSPNPRIRELGHAAMRKSLQRLGDALASRIGDACEPRRFFLRYFLVIAGPALLSNTWDEFCLSSKRLFGTGSVPDAPALAEELVAFSAAGLRARGSTSKGKKR
jgi:AcrR family transcriptional regulator